MHPIEFIINSEYIELCNLLKLVGLADSGGRGKTMVGEGIVSVDGVTELRKTAKIRAGQQVECECQQVLVIQGEITRTASKPIKPLKTIKHSSNSKTKRAVSSPFDLKSKTKRPKK